jgi:hypothetical protein
MVMPVNQEIAQGHAEASRGQTHWQHSAVHRWPVNHWNFQARVDAAAELYEGLLMLQHRGQDSAGMVTTDWEKFVEHKNNGLVMTLTFPPWHS